MNVGLHGKIKRIEYDFIQDVFSEIVIYVSIRKTGFFGK